MGDQVLQHQTPTTTAGEPDYRVQHAGSFNSDYFDLPKNFFYKGLKIVVSQPFIKIQNFQALENIMQKNTCALM